MGDNIYSIFRRNRRNEKEKQKEKHTGWWTKAVYPHQQSEKEDSTTKLHNKRAKHNHWWIQAQRKSHKDQRTVNIDQETDRWKQETGFDCRGFEEKG